MPDGDRGPMILKIAIALVVVVVAFVAWRYTSVARGANARDQILLARLDPLAQRFQAKAAVSAEDVRLVANAPELRPMLYAMLSHYAATDLFPAQFLSPEAQAESTLVYWMLHPNELQAAPSAIELVEKLNRQVHGHDGTFYVFRYKMLEGHWAGADWMLGLAGPFAADDKPYQSRAGGFSRAGDIAGKVNPAELVDWYVGMVGK
jgi:hypothetical protein